MSYFANKYAVLTGAGSGIGRELAIQLAAQGCNLAISDINASSLTETVAMLPITDQQQLLSEQLDVGDREAFHLYAKKIIGEFPQIDLVINNAGVANRNVSCDELDYAEYERVINVNLWGVIHGSHEFMPALLANPGSHLVNLSSIFGLIAPAGCAPYCATKFAVRGYTESLITELAPRGVKVSSVHPGVIATNIVKAVDGPRETIEAFEKRGMPPADAARLILKGVAAGKKRIRVTGGAYLLDWIQRILPSGYRPLVNRLLSP
ncbi:SDR family NAD(P)-dependent oxidoreductase [Microbulbifer hainanensis]|uniref:SDR family NAD(P)-dependent oxidoreductase n=1 Tax=Microbulbifer hainanensis TaxID=2735675 RepID=UPI001868D21E|nr:SDR family oxidoreductase [Microbulbifer hainanensis]